jgi:hypothetical protein
MMAMRGPRAGESAFMKRDTVIALLLSVCSLAAAHADPPKKLGDCNLQGERNVWIRDSAGTVEEPFDLSQPLPKITPSTPSTLRSHCGMQTRLLDTIDDGVIRVSLPGEKSNAFIPLHLSDKTGGYYCTAIRPKVACVTEARTSTDGSIELLLRTLPSGAASEARITVGRDGIVTSGSLHPEFALMQIPRKIKGENFDVRDLIRKAAQDVDCTGKTARDCLADRQYAVERRAMEFVRIDRRVRLGKPDIVSDVRGFLTKYSPLTGDRALAHRAIVVNEIGVTSDPEKAYASPYEVLDAVLSASGPSFGAHQVDVGSNTGSEREPFRAAMKRIAERPNADPEFKRIEATRGFERPGREYDTKTLVIFHTSMAALTAELRTDGGRLAVDGTYDGYLVRAAGCFARLRARGEPFISSRFAMLYVVDVANQSGPTRGKNVALKALAATAEGKSPAQAEQAMIDYIMSLKPGAPERQDVQRRVDDIRAVIKEWGAKPLGGGDAEHCDVGGF